MVVGAGVVGLATARRILLDFEMRYQMCSADKPPDVIVVEHGPSVGVAANCISSRNSEVVHAGVYYPHGSLKAKCCVQGRRDLYDYCDSRGVVYKKFGKLIVATSKDQHAQLEQIRERSLQAGLTENDALQWLSGEEAVRMEPNLACTAALWSPETGVIDSHGLMLALQGDVEALGGTFAFNTAVVDIESSQDLQAFTIRTDDGSKLECGRIVNCAGLFAPALASAVRGRVPSPVAFPKHVAKGNYFRLVGAKAPFSRLVYPIPGSAGLGVHITLDLAGRARFGPDVEWMSSEDIRDSSGRPRSLDFTVDGSRVKGFYEEIRKYWPGLVDGCLEPDYAGIRPKLQSPGEPAADFSICGPRDHGVPGLVHLLGIESPGLTSSLEVARLASEALYMCDDEVMLQ